MARKAVATSTPVSAPVVAKQEENPRAAILQSILNTPHRDLFASQAVHQQIRDADPMFYVHLAAWYNQFGEIRDHKELFVTNLALSKLEAHRDVGLALLHFLAPHQVARVVQFIKGKKHVTSVVTGTGKAKKVEKKVEWKGLKVNVPRSLRTEIERYLRKREKNSQKFAKLVVQFRTTLKAIYASLHIKPSPLADKLLFKEESVEGMQTDVVKKLSALEDPTEQAKMILENKIPYRIAASVVKNMTPAVLVALVSVMSPQEIINNLGSLKERGALDNPQIKKLVDAGLNEAKKDKRVQAFKTSTAEENVELDEDTKSMLADVRDARVKAKGRITRSTALLVDKSGSLHVGIEVAKQIAAMTSAIMDAPLYVYAFDTSAIQCTAQGTDMKAWEKAFSMIKPSGGTIVGAPLTLMQKQGVKVEQLVIVTDEGDNADFSAYYKNYAKTTGMSPDVIIVRVGQPCSIVEQSCKANGINVQVFEFKGDNYALANLIPLLAGTSILDIVTEIMTFPLPERKAFQTKKA